jgi:hypothetical protein
MHVEIQKLGRAHRVLRRVREIRIIDISVDCIESHRLLCNLKTRVPDAFSHTMRFYSLSIMK